MCGIRCLSSKNGETRAGRTIWHIVRASKLVADNSYTFDRSSCTRRFIAEEQGTSGKALTAKPFDQNLYWCRIPDHSWSRTVLHDNTTLTSSYNMQSQWHVVSILYHEMTNQLTRKVGFEGTPKLGPYWKSQPATCKVNMEWKLELNLWTQTILTCGSESLMDSTSWSQAWSTKSTTTTSRKPLRRRRKQLRWKRTYSLLQADQRLKQNQEDLPLLAHLLELYLFVKEDGVILNQELNRISRTQWPKWLNTLLRHGQLPQKKMVRLNSGD